MASKTPLIDQIILRASAICKKYSVAMSYEWDEPLPDSLTKDNIIMVSGVMSSWHALRYAAEEVICSDDAAIRLFGELCKFDRKLDAVDTYGVGGQYLMQMILQESAHKLGLLQRIEDAVPHYDEVINERTRTLSAAMQKFRQ